MRTSTPPAALAAERRAAVSAIRFAAPLHAPEAGLLSLPTLARFNEAVWRADCDGEPVGEKVLSHMLDAVNAARASLGCSAYSASSVQTPVLGALIAAVPAALHRSFVVCHSSTVVGRLQRLACDDSCMHREPTSGRCYLIRSSSDCGMVVVSFLALACRLV